MVGLNTEGLLDPQSCPLREYQFEMCSARLLGLVPDLHPVSVGDGAIAASALLSLGSSWGVQQAGTIRLLRDGAGDRFQISDILVGS